MRERHAWIGSVLAKIRRFRNQDIESRPRSEFWIYALATILITLGVVTLRSLEETHAANSDSPAVTYAQGTLRATIPYRLTHAGSGRLIVEVLDPDDEVLARSERQVDVGAAPGSWQQEFKLAKPIAIEDLVWHRLRYRFQYSDEKEVVAHGSDSISQILRTPVLHILGQQSYLAGGPAGVRVVVTDSKNELIAGSSTVRIDLVAPDKKPRVLFTGRLNRRGTAEAQFRFPAGLAGSYPLHYVVDTPIGSTEFTQQVRLEEKASILLTTEKPLYQPGQTIHVRALALDRSSHEATAGRKLTFELEDSRGNKVFKKVTQTGKFGIASAEFILAEEVNLGTYHLRALMGDGASPNSSEIALNVERYVLPKFKVAVDFAETTGKQAVKHGYRPGDHVTGTVRANYFFGKPVESGELTVKASSMDVALFEAASVQGKTDSEGTYRFDITLPRFFAGRQTSQGAARVLIEATVKDSAGHSETRGAPITVSESPMIITAIPEGGKLIPNLENQVFILTSYPDGQPASATIKVRCAGNPDQTATTDEGGVAIVRLNAGTGLANVNIDATDKDGNRATTSARLEARDGQDQILLRTARGVYRAGDRIQLKVFSTKKQGSAYVDVVKDGQTVLTRDLNIVDGQAELSLVATPELAGTVDLNAYVFGADARPVADHRLVFVQPADELQIEATTDAKQYKPGDEARIRFRVTNARGEGVQAALGLQVVDEAVFALAEKQPGFAKVFFYLEQEVMKPRYEIHSIGMRDIVEPVGKSDGEQRDRAARALFSATEIVNSNKFETEFGRTAPQAKRGEYDQRYQARFLSDVRRLSGSLSRAYLNNSEGGDLAKVLKKLPKSSEVRDAWDTDFRIEPVSWNQQKKYYLVKSAGTDRQFNTSDDMAAYVEVRSGKLARNPGTTTSSIQVNIEHERGPFNGMAEITGLVLDPSQATVPGATVEAREVSSGKIRKATTDAGGRFQLSALPAGEYEVRIQCPGFRSAAGDVSIKARDRAQLATTLQVGAVSESVVVMAGPGSPMTETGRAQRMRVGGVVGGIVGGVPGGMGGGGGADFELRQFAPPAMAAAPRDALVLKAAPANGPANTMTMTKDKSEAPAARVRSYFPEALYINPEIVTDHNGSASIVIPIADSITTWRMAMIASTTRGALGSATSSLKVFQDFFVDLDLPVTLTQGDRVSLPVAAYNYSGTAGDVRLKLQPEDWFTLVDNDSADKALTVESGKVGGAQYTIEAKRIGKFKLTLAARMNGGSGRGDIVVREIEVIPNGREQSQVFNGRLDTAVQHDLKFPAASVADASKVLVRLYPGPLSQVIEGIDSLLRMPGGCFEQTSSSTYPNVLALDYMKRTKKLTPEVHAKAEGFITNGYQRLLTFEVPGGGFSWFGAAPANKILTSYGLMEFYDMSKVHEVDPKLIERTQNWLASQQQPDGSWKPDTSFINEGATNRYNSDVLRITAYIAWALGNTGYRGPSVEKAKQFIEKKMDGSKLDTYTLAVLANFAADYQKDREFLRRSMQLLLDARTEKGEQAWWTAEETSVYATGTSAAVETTGLAVQALLKWGGASTTSAKALSYLAQKKDASGTWGTTQATIMALRALLLSTEKSSADVQGTLEVSLNGKVVEKLELNSSNNDLLHQFVFKSVDAKGSNQVQIRFEGKGGLAYQVVGKYFLPWTETPAAEPLSIGVAYDRTHLAQDEIATATAMVKNNLKKTANMVMIDLGIPPGFDLLSEDLQAFQEKTAGKKGGKLEKFSMTATQAILYFDSIGAGESVTVKFRLRAKYPIRAKTLQSRVYEYYDPEVNSVARPIQLEVRKR